MQILNSTTLSLSIGEQTSGKKAMTVLATIAPGEAYSMCSARNLGSSLSGLLVCAPSPHALNAHKRDTKLGNLEDYPGFDPQGIQCKRIDVPLSRCLSIVPDAGQFSLKGHQCAATKERVEPRAFTWVCA